MTYNFNTTTVARYKIPDDEPPIIEKPEPNEYGLEVNDAILYCKDYELHAYRIVGFTKDDLPIILVGFKQEYKVIVNPNTSHIVGKYVQRRKWYGRKYWKLELNQH